MEGETDQPFQTLQFVADAARFLVHKIQRPSEWAAKLVGLETTYRALLKGSTNKEATLIRGWGRDNERSGEVGKTVLEFCEGGLRLELEAAAENIREAKEG